MGVHTEGLEVMRKAREAEVTDHLDLVCVARKREEPMRKTAVEWKNQLKIYRRGLTATLFRCTS
jgi:hypothetical protein